MSPVVVGGWRGQGRGEGFIATQPAIGRVVDRGRKSWVRRDLSDKVRVGTVYLRAGLSSLLQCLPAAPVWGDWNWLLEGKRSSKRKGAVGFCKRFVAGSTHHRGGARGRECWRGCWSRMSRRSETRTRRSSSTSCRGSSSRGSSSSSSGRASSGSSSSSS